MKRLNWKIIKNNVSEARQELEEIESLIESGELPEEGELQIMVEHAYHPSTLRGMPEACLLSGMQI